MTIGKREKILLVALGIIIYLFVFFNWVWLPVVPNIKEKSAQLVQAQQRKVALDNELKNIENKRKDINAKNITNQKLNEYLSSNSNTVDSIVYIETLAQLLDKKLASIKIDKPKERTVGDEDTAKTGKGSPKSGKKYYEFKIGFKVNLNYDETTDLVKFIEEGSRKVRISKFDMKSLTKGEDKAKQQAQNSKAVDQQTLATANDGKLMFNIDMEINLYSLNLENADRMYEYSRHKFNKYPEGESSKPFIAPIKEVEGKAPALPTQQEANQPNNSSTPDNKAGQNTQGNKQTGSGVDISSADILIFQESFLLAGNNFRVYGNDKLNDIFETKTKNYFDVALNVDSNSYSINTIDGGQSLGGLSCPLPQSDLKVYITANYPLVKENENLGINLIVSNNTSKKIFIKMEDKVGRVKIKDRNGNAIYSSNQKEGVYVV